MINSATKKLSAAACVLVASLLLIHWLPFQPAVTYAVTFVFASVAYLWIARLLFSSDPTAKFLYVSIGIVLLVRASFLNSNPIGSDDVYRYMWDGKVQAAGNNPYLLTPNDARLDSLHSQLLPAMVNHPDMKSVYFPLSQWVFYCCYRISGENIWGYKLVLLLAEIATVIGLFLLVPKLNISPKFVLLYALCPLTVTQFALDAHLDGVGLPLLVFGLFFYLEGKKPLSYVLFALSISIKPIAVLILPILFFRERGISNKAQVFLVPCVVIGAQFLPYVFGSNALEGLTTFAKHWTFNGVVFETLNLYFDDNQKTRVICAILLCVSLLVLYWRKKDFVDAFYFSVLLLLIFSPVVHPWYVSWLAVLLPLTRRWSGIVYASTISLTTYTILNYKLHGVWEQSAIVLALEYLPVLILLILEFRNSIEKTDVVGA